jgi:hypothetical protein
MKTTLMVLLATALLSSCTSAPIAQESAQAAAGRRAATLEDTQRLLRESDATLAKGERTMAEIYRTLFTRDGATPLDFDRDKWACDRDLGLLETRGSAARRPIGGSFYLNDLEKCLALTGWQRAARKP